MTDDAFGNGDSKVRRNQCGFEFLQKSRVHRSAQQPIEGAADCGARLTQSFAETLHPTHTLDLVCRSQRRVRGSDEPADRTQAPTHLPFFLLHAQRLRPAPFVIIAAEM